MSDALVVLEDDWSELLGRTRDPGVPLPAELSLEDCDLTAQAPPRELGGVEWLEIEGGRLDVAALERWWRACPDLRGLALESVAWVPDEDGGCVSERGLRWSELPPRVRALTIHGGSVPRLVDPPAVSGLVHLTVSACDLRELALPPSLSGLESLDLSHNPALGRCPDLPWSAVPFRLDLKGCGLEAWPRVPGSEKVVKLDLSGNALGALPAELGDWTSLESLRAVQAGVTSVAALPASRHLGYVQFTRNPLERWPAGLEALPGLKVLLLDDCGLTRVPDDLGRLARLEALILKRNPIEALPESLAELTELRRLDLWHTAVRRLPEGLSRLARLRLLDVGYTPLERLPDLSTLPELQVLELCGLRALDWEQGFEALAGVRQLTSASFTNNDFSRFDERVLAIPGLERLNVNKTRVDPAQYRELGERHPGVLLWGADRPA